METQLVIAVLLLVGAIIIWIRPQSITTLNGYSEEKLRNVNLKKVRLTAGGGMALLAVLLGGGSWALSRAGVGDMVITVIGIVVIFLGIFVIAARVETYNHNK